MKSIFKAVLPTAFLCVLLCGCASVPFSTLVRMSAFDARDFSKLEAEELRVKIRLPEGFRLNVEESWLGIQISSAAGVHDATFQLDEESLYGVNLPGRIFSSASAGAEYVLKLSAPSTAKFRELQAFVAQAPAQDINIKVVPKLSSYPEDATSVRVWISLLLSPAQGYFALLDGTTISLSKVRERRLGAQQAPAREVRSARVMGIVREQ
ncbi:MAG: hypothetical protein SXG53_04940 [Pseudomonadota bacterium]|nr:hypothetical protein [Pseudomonadota bacterium]